MYYADAELKKKLLEYFASQECYIKYIEPFTVSPR